MNTKEINLYKVTYSNTISNGFTSKIKYVENLFEIEDIVGDILELTPMYVEYMPVIPLAAAEMLIKNVSSSKRKAEIEEAIQKKKAELLELENNLNNHEGC